MPWLLGKAFASVAEAAQQAAQTALALLHSDAFAS
jgi:hypothetical protein